MTTVTSFDENVTDMFSGPLLHWTAGEGEAKMGEGMSTDGVSAGCEINRLGNGAAVLLLSAITTE